jgi:type I site-specific restriction-modification system R (restriction) subunit
MVVECNITKDNADYYVEAYTIDYAVGDDNVVKQIGKTRLAYVAGYRDYSLEEEQQITLMLQLKDKLRDFYSTYPDGEVTVKLVIKEDNVNV